MLRVVLPRSNSSIFSIQRVPSGASENGIYTLIDNQIVKVTHKYAIILDQYNETVSLEGDIRTWPCDILEGENNCLHTNLVGDIYPLDSMSAAGGIVKYTKATPNWGPQVPLLMPVYTATVSPTVYCNYTDLLTMGEVCSYEIQYDEYDVKTKKKRGTTVLTECSFWLNGCMWIARGMCSTLQSGSSLSAYCVEPGYYRGYRIKIKWNEWVVSAAIIKTGDALRDHLISCIIAADYPTGPFSLTVGTAVSFTTGHTLPVYSRLLHVSSTLLDQLLPIENSFRGWGDLSYAAASQTQTWSNNGLAFSKEIIGLRGELGKTLKALAGLVNPKLWASTYLSFKYGLQLTIADARTLVTEMKLNYSHLGPAKVSSSTTFYEGPIVYQYHYAIYYERYDTCLDKIYYLLSKYDLLPDFSNVWDLQAFSFVLDWLVDLGEAFDLLDVVIRLSRYNLVGAMSSIKTSRIVSAADLGFPEFSGNILISRYYRKADSFVYAPSVTPDSIFTKGFDHWIESGALLVQKLIH